MGRSCAQKAEPSSLPRSVRHSLWAEWLTEARQCLTSCEEWERHVAAGNTWANQASPVGEAHTPALLSCYVFPVSKAAHECLFFSPLRASLLQLRILLLLSLKKKKNKLWEQRGTHPFLMESLHPCSHLTHVICLLSADQPILLWCWTRPSLRPRHPPAMPFYFPGDTKFFFSIEFTPFSIRQPWLSPSEHTALLTPTLSPDDLFLRWSICLDFSK